MYKMYARVRVFSRRNSFSFDVHLHVDTRLCCSQRCSACSLTHQALVFIAWVCQVYVCRLYQ